MDYILIKKQEDPAAIKAVAGALAEGKVIILPAATIYGISCRFDDEQAIKNIYSLKNRRKHMPFIILISDNEQLGLLAKDISPGAVKLIKKYWDLRGPLPLTLIFRKKECIEGYITGGKDTIAVRMAGLKAVRDIIDISGPIVSTSANISGQNINPSSVEEIPDEIKENVDVVVGIEGGLSGTGSTIVDISSGTPFLIRQGAVSFDDVLADLGQ